MDSIKRKNKDARAWTLLHNPKTNNFELYASKYANGKENYISEVSPEVLMSIIDEIEEEFKGDLNIN